jgi:cell wall-associated NlpC family hydrolase
MPLGFGALLLGAITLIAGITGSTFGSVAKGAPDHSNAKTPEGGGSSTSAPAVTPVGKGVPGKGLATAITQLGTPYKWGGEAAKIAFDCSGLVQWAYGQVGVNLPRTAQAQYSATHRVSQAEAQPGDLVFFGSSTSNITHVGILAGVGKMIDATHPGASVEYSNFNPAIGSSWGEDRVIGYGTP